MGLLLHVSGGLGSLHDFSAVSSQGPMGLIGVLNWVGLGRVGSREFGD